MRRRCGIGAAAKCSSSKRRTPPRSRWRRTNRRGSRKRRRRRAPASAPPGAPPPSMRHCLLPRRRGRGPPGRAPRRGPAKARIVPARGSWFFVRDDEGFGARLARPLQRLGGFGRHVVLVVLGEHLVGAEHAVGTELAL